MGCPLQLKGHEGIVMDCAGSSDVGVSKIAEESNAGNEMETGITSPGFLKNLGSFFGVSPE